jgi:hypothetical protein
MHAPPREGFRFQPGAKHPGPSEMVRRSRLSLISTVGVDSVVPGDPAPSGSVWSGLVRQNVGRIIQLGEGLAAWGYGRGSWT